MKIILIENQSKKQIGELNLETQPRNGEWIEFKQDYYSIHKIIHTIDSLKLMVIGVR